MLRQLSPHVANNSPVALQHSYRKVGDHRGKKRIWLDGLKLDAAGFEYGASITVDFQSGTGVFKVFLDEKGERRVSGRKCSKTGKIKPIIDLSGEYVKALGNNAKRVRVDFHYGELKISIHHQDKKQTEREEAFIENICKGTITKGTLGAGIGIAAAALTDGLADAGIKSKTLWAVDRESKYLQVAVDNNYSFGDETTIFHASLEELEEDLIPQTDVVQFSLACTSSSKSGKAKNKNTLAEEHETDATGLFGLMNIAKTANPAIWVSENVVEAKNTATYILICQMFKLLGYRISECILDEDQAGSIEARKRYWFIAVSNGLPEIHIDQLMTYAKQFRTVEDVLEDEESTADLWCKHDYLDAKEKRDIARGVNFRRNLVDKKSTKVGTLGRFYNKRRSTEPFLVNEQGLERLFTAREHARLKNIPECLIEGVFETTAHEGLGQSILFNHGRGIGRLIGSTYGYVSNVIFMKPFKVK